MSKYHCCRDYQKVHQILQLKYLYLIEDVVMFMHHLGDPHSFHIDKGSHIHAIIP